MTPQLSGTTVKRPTCREDEIAQEAILFLKLRALWVLIDQPSCCGFYTSTLICHLANTYDELQHCSSVTKQYVSLRVDAPTHDNVVRYAEKLQAAKGQQITINDALTHLLEECYADVSGAFGAEIKIKKLGCGGHRKLVEVK